MNLRQKYKRIKKENERLKKIVRPMVRQPILESRECKILTLAGENIVHDFEYDAEAIDYAQKCVVRNLSDKLMPYIEFEKYFNENGDVAVKGQIKVVLHNRPKKKEMEC